MPVHTVFLGWERHALESAADFVIGMGEKDGGTVDLSRLVVVLPTSRAMRRLTELLVERARAVALPEMITAGSLAQLAAKPDLPLATDSERLLAWIVAMDRLPDDSLFPLVRRSLSESDMGFRLSLAIRIDSLWSELAASDLDFEAVARMLEGEIDGERWLALSEIQSSYLDTLFESGREDGYLFRRSAAAEPRDLGKTTILIGCADLNPVARKLLFGSLSEVFALVQADEADASRFDSVGCLVSSAWTRARLPLEIAKRVVAEKPSDQALAAIGFLEELTEEYGPSRVALASAQPEILSHLQSYLESLGCDAVDASGYPYERTAPFALLRNASRYLETRRFEDLGSFVRHPHVHRKIRAELGEEGGSVAAELDRFHSEHLPGRLASDLPAGSRRAAGVKRIMSLVDRFLEPLRGERMTLGEWAARIGQFMELMYGGLGLSSDSLTAVNALARAIWDVGDELSGFSLASGIELAGSEAVSFFCERLRSERVSPEPGETSLELLGWLELPLDDSDAAIICGFNDGHVPQALNEDAFLPNALRSRLGLTDNEARYARDAYVLDAVLRSRRDVRLISGRRDSSDGRLRPSRLCFACSEVEIAQRVRDFYESPAVRVSMARSEPSQPALFTLFPPGSLVSPLESLPVTAFKDYIECPYRFYLKHVLRLRSSDDLADEMDGGLFGTLLHEVLARFGKDEGSHSDDSRATAAALLRHLDESIRARFGASPRPAVPLQIEQAKGRLRHFAALQAELYAEGWRVHRVEMDLPGATSLLDVDGSAVRITGRIDRIDRNIETGEWRVIDYKTSDKKREPRAALSKDGWKDLQLPLYRHLLEATGEISSPQLAYVSLPAAIKDLSLSVAGWNDDEIASGIEKARDVVRSIRQNVFWPPNPKGPPYDDLGVLCGAGQLFETEEEV